ncbi:hypothetical protein Clacol_005493 [Clathrus columnatus]|uniref:Dihydroxyacetone kinase n=1 Tax=Clathrus columnatus TaxID=1419009 RepID=A0AAV5AE55_9AGAM|nr:hypothetical protein Clacol_005493 [Clathrus columnatus]
MVLNKHLINNPTTLVIEALQGLAYQNPTLSLDIKNKVVYRSNINKDQVALICGGGSGHEPSHAGFVGEGILTAAVCGNVFASPNASQVTRAIELVDGDQGNYTGDILNFGLAKEMYAAAHPEKSKKVKFLVVGDDVSVGRTQGGIVGRRGLAGTVLVYKIAGALSARNANIDRVYNVAAWVAERLGTVGIGLEHCHIPGTLPAQSHLSSDEIELGMGIHNEPGYAQVSPVPKLSDLVNDLLTLVISTSDPERSFLPFGSGSGQDEVVLMVNNLGGVSELELSGITREVILQLDAKKIKVKRVLVGAYMTSLNMPGFSLTLLLLPRNGEKAPASTEELLALLDDKTHAPGWKWSSGSPPGTINTAPEEQQTTSSNFTSTGRKIAAADPAGFVKAIKRAATAIIQSEPELTHLDSIAGDGDAGLTHKSGAERVLSIANSGSLDGKDVINSIAQIAKAASDAMDGTSGALYSIFFSSLVQSLHQSTEGKPELTLDIWTESLSGALDQLYTYTRARHPSRTLIDPIAVFVEALQSGNSLSDAVAKASTAADETKNLEARAGRAAYVGKDKVKGVADPGAIGVKVILQALIA